MAARRADAQEREISEIQRWLGEFSVLKKRFNRIDNTQVPGATDTPKTPTTNCRCPGAVSQSPAKT
jgi:hypothetical protein